MSFEEQLGIKFSVLISGLIGGIVALTFEEKLSFLRALLIIFTGGVTAAYSSQALIHYFELKEVYVHFFGFLTGLISMRITAVIGNFTKKIVEDPSILLKIIERLWKR